MNRRKFTQSLVALFSIPALPALPTMAGATASAAITVPAKAQSWAIYMSSLHGQCTPQSLQAVLNIPTVEAKRYVTQLIADGVIKPNPILKSALSDIVKDKKENLLDRLKERIEMKLNGQPADENLDAEIETVEAPVTQEIAYTDGAIVQTEITPPPSSAVSRG